MKKLFGLLSLIALSILAFKPADYKTVSNLSYDDGWVELINGKDFTGWKATENTSTWSITDGLFQADGKVSYGLGRSKIRRWYLRNKIGKCPHWY